MTHKDTVLNYLLSQGKPRTSSQTWNDVRSLTGDQVARALSALCREGLVNRIGSAPFHYQAVQ